MTTQQGNQSFQEKRLLEEIHGQFFSKLDWWQASVDISSFETFSRETGEIIPAIDVLKHEIALLYPMSSWITSAGHQAYQWTETLKRGDSVLLTIMHGGVHSSPNFKATGSRSAEFRNLITSWFPTGGKISRVDSAFDSLSGTAKFNEVARWLESRADAAGMNYEWITNSDPNLGNTLYVGSKGSRVVIRLYEKGKQLGINPGQWWRAEVQLRPHSKAKSEVYSWSSGYVWSVSPITRDLWAYLGGENLAAAGFQYQEKERDLSDRLLHLATQYGNLLAEALAVFETGNGVIAYMDGLLKEVGKQPINGRVAPIPQCPF